MTLFPPAQCPGLLLHCRFYSRPAVASLGGQVPLSVSSCLIGLLTLEDAATSSCQPLIQGSIGFPGVSVGGAVPGIRAAVLLPSVCQRCSGAWPPGACSGSPLLADFVSPCTALRWDIHTVLVSQRNQEEVLSQKNHRILGHLTWGTLMRKQDCKW